MKYSVLSVRFLFFCLLIALPGVPLISQEKFPDVTLAVSTPPVVVLTSPTKNQLNRSRSTNITATFNVDMNTSTFTGSNILLYGSKSGLHSGAITNNGTTGFTFNPTNDFKAGEAVTVNLGSAIMSDGALPLSAGYHWSFFVQATGGTGVYTQTSAPDLGFGATPVASVCADFNNDGYPDLATVNQGTNNLSILLNNGNGSFTIASTPSAGTGRTAITSGDFDADGDIDLAVAGGGASGTAAIMENDGLGSFTLDSSPSAGLGPQAVMAGDVDGDGDLDLVVALNSVNKIAVLKNDGFMGFTSSSTPDVGTGPQSVFLGDVDGDGDLDVATANFFGNDASILFNDGTGTYGTAVSVSTDAQPNEITGGDFNNDGDIDLAVTNRTTNTLSILSNNGSGVFTETANPACSNTPFSVTACDVDADGDLDLAVTKSGGDSITVFKNNGTGTFSSFSSLPVGSQPFSVSYGDMDADGDIDLAVVNRSSATVSILRNNYTPPAVTVTSPTRNQNGVSVSTNISLRFNQAMNTSTIGMANMLLTGSQSGKHTGSVTFSGDTMVTINPDVDFKRGEVVTLNLNKSIVSAGGDSLSNGFHYSFTTAAVGGTASFAITANQTVGSVPTALIMGDVDGNGSADVAVVNFSSNSVTVAKNNGNGFFSDTASYAVGANPSGIASGDFDSDGDVDLVITNSTDATITILLNNGSGAFSPGSTPATGSTPAGVAVGDVDGDADLDLVVVCQFANTIYVHRNDGSGAFPSSTQNATGSLPNAIAIGDVDADGDLDVAVTNSGARTISILKNNGSGNFNSSATATTGDNPYAIAPLDVDADGDLDMAVVCKNEGALSVMKNNGSGTFTESSAPTLGTAPAGIATGDFDGDGDIDAVVTNQNDHSMTILKNNGSGTFTKTTLTDLTNSPAGIASADVDGDGDMDAVAVLQSSAKFSALKNNVSAGFALSKSSIDYGGVVFGSGNKKDSVMVYNTGDAQLLITSVSSSSVAFSVTPTGATVEPSDSQKFYISFAPTSLSPFSGRIVFTHDAPGTPDTVLVSGTGVQNTEPVFNLVPASVNFGTMLVNTTQIETVLVANTGHSDLIIDTVISDNPEVTVTPATDTIAALTSVQFFISVTPTSVETVTAHVVFSSNDAGSPDTLTVFAISALTLPHYYLTLPPDSMIIKVPGKKTYLKPVARVKKGVQPYPNWANLLSEVVAQGGFRANSTESDSMGGMRLGISFITQSGKNRYKQVKDSAAVRGWVRLTKWTFPTTKLPGKGTGFEVLQKTMEDKTGRHDSLARGFDSTGYPGQLKPKRKALLKEMTTLLPGNHDNTLYAELVALKFNIAASQLEKTPAGFGELIFDVDGNPCDELHVKDISRKADSALTYWKGRTQEYYDSLYSAIYRINRAFVAPLDTVSFKAGNNLVVESAIDVASIGFLRYDSSAVVAVLPPAQASVSADEFTAESDELEPVTTALFQNYPNPFNPTTTIGFRIGAGELAFVTLKIYNMLGQEVSVVINNQPYEAGEHSVSFDGGALSSGVYYYTLTVHEANERAFSSSKKLLLVK